MIAKPGFRKHLWKLAGALVVVGCMSGGLFLSCWNDAVPLAVMGLNYIRYLNAPAGFLTTEVNKNFSTAAPAAATARDHPLDDDWPSYNKTLTSDRFSRLSEIDKDRGSEERLAQVR